MSEYHTYVELLDQAYNHFGTIIKFDDLNIPKFDFSGNPVSIKYVVNLWLDRMSKKLLYKLYTDRIEFRPLF